MSIDATVMTLSYHDPSTFRLGTEEQKSQLRAIATEEFSLSHLPDDIQPLVGEALRFSGIEVENACVVEKETNGKINAFFRRMKQTERQRFDPNFGVMKIAVEGDTDVVDQEWQKIYGSYTEYPYPLGEAQVIPKVVPLDLSSIALGERTEDYIRFTAEPSALLFVVLRPQDQILAKEDLEIEFEVSLESKRITRQTLRLKKPRRVYFGIKIKELVATYKYSHDSIADRNVITDVQHSMRGSIGGIFRPNFTVSTALTYIDCNGAPRSQSYLYESIEAIEALN